MCYHFSILSFHYCFPLKSTEKFPFIISNLLLTFIYIIYIFRIAQLRADLFHCLQVLQEHRSWLSQLWALMRGSGSNLEYQQQRWVVYRYYIDYIDSLLNLLLNVCTSYIHPVPLINFYFILSYLMSPCLYINRRIQFLLYHFSLFCSSTFQLFVYQFHWLFLN